MGNETSFPSLIRSTSNEKAILQAQLQWAIAQTSRVNFSQSLINQSIHAPLIVPSIQQAIARSNSQSMNSLYNHLTYSVDLLCSNIDDLLNNKEISQRGLQPKDARINGYHITNDFVQQPNNQSISSMIGQMIASLGLDQQSPDEPISFSEFLIDDSEESLIDRALIGSRFVLLQSVNQSINQAIMYALTLIEQKAYLAKRLSISQDYYEDHAFVTSQSIDQTLNTLLPILTTTRMAFVMLYRDFQLQSHKQIINEWVRVLTGLQSTWANGPAYQSPCQTISHSFSQSNNHIIDPVIDQLLTKVGDKQQLIGISLTSPNQSHLAPTCAPPRTSGNLNKLFDPVHFLDQLINQLHVKARLVDMALRHNEIEAVNVSVGSVPNQSINLSRFLIPDDRLFVIPPSDIKRAHRRVVSQLGLARRHTVNATDVKMAVTNMRNRLSTLTHAMVQLGDTKGNRSPQPSEQLEKITAEAHNEACGLRSMFDLFMPQIVLELTKTLGSVSDQSVQQQLNHLKSNLIGMTPYARSMLTLSPPPIPQRASRPSLSVKLAKEQPTIQPVEVAPPKPQRPAYASSSDRNSTELCPSRSPHSSTSADQSHGSITPQSQESSPLSPTLSNMCSPQSNTFCLSPDHSAEPSVSSSECADVHLSKNLIDELHDDVEPGCQVELLVALPVAQPIAQPVAIVASPTIASPDVAPVVKPEGRHRRSPSFGLLAQETYGIDLTKLEEHVPRDTPEFEMSVHHQLDSLRHVGIKLTAPDAKEYWWKKVFVQEHQSEPLPPATQTVNQSISLSVDQPVYQTMSKSHSFENISSMTVGKQAESSEFSHSQPIRAVPPPLPAKPSRVSFPPPIPKDMVTPDVASSQLITSPLHQSGSDPSLNKQLPMKESKEKSSGLRTSRRRASETSQPVFTSTLASLLPPRRYEPSLDQPHSPGEMNLKNEEMSPISANSSSAPLRTSPSNSPPSGLRSIIKKNGSPDGRRRGNVTFAADIRGEHQMSSFERYNLRHGGDSVYTYGSDDDSSRLKSRGMSRDRTKYLREGDVLKRASVTTGPSNHGFRQEPHYI